MMANKVEIKAFISKMEGLFGAPYKDAEGEVVSILAKYLQPFDKEILDAVAEHFAMTREFKTWPMPKEIITACKAELTRRNPSPPRPAKIDYLSDERIEKADKLILSSLGVQACEGGWLDELWDFCRRKERLPEPHEIDAICRDADRHYQKFDAALNRINNDKGWGKKATPLRNKLADLAERIKEYSKRREDRVREWAKKNAA